MVRSPKTPVCCSSRAACGLRDAVSATMAVSSLRVRILQAASALAAAAESGEQFEHRVEGGFERFGVAFDLREEQAALQCGK